MAAINIDMSTIDATIQVLKIPLLLLGILLLYRTNRIISSIEESFDYLEHTAENVEHSSETIESFVDLLRKIPLVKGDKDE